MKLSPFERNVLVVLTPYQAFITKKVLEEKFKNNAFIKQEREVEIKEIKKLKWAWKLQRKIDKCKRIIRKIVDHQEPISEVISIITESERSQKKYQNVLKKLNYKYSHK